MKTALSFEYGQRISYSFFDVGRTEEHKQLAESATTEFYLYLSELISDRRKKPKEDLISSLVAAQDAGEMNEAELISTCMLILAAGHGSTIDVLGRRHARTHLPSRPTGSASPVARTHPDGGAGNVSI